MKQFDLDVPEEVEWSDQQVPADQQPGQQDQHQVYSGLEQRLWIIEFLEILEFGFLELLLALNQGIQGHFQAKIQGRIFSNALVL